jgi:hypothetical protein
VLRSILVFNRVHAPTVTRKLSVSFVPFFVRRFSLDDYTIGKNLFIVVVERIAPVAARVLNK